MTSVLAKDLLRTFPKCLLIRNLRFFSIILDFAAFKSFSLFFGRTNLSNFFWTNLGCWPTSLKILFGWGVVVKGGAGCRR